MCVEKILFVLNPSSGSSDEVFFKKKIVSDAKQAGFEPADFFYLNHDTFAIVKEKISCYDVIVVGGGDGTISSIINIAASLERKPRIALLPLGTGNDLCRSLKIFDLFKKRGFKAIREMIIKGKTVRVDLIKTDSGLRFVNYFGLGSDALVAHEFEHLRKRVFVKSFRSTFCNKIYFSFLGLKNVFSRLNHDIILKIKTGDGNEREVLIPKKARGLIINNITSYAGGARVCSFSKLNDGRFEVIIISSLVQLIFLHFTRFLKKPLDCFLPSVKCFQTEYLTVEFYGKPPCQIDGEAVNCFSKSLNRISFSTVAGVEVFVP